jgi:hypothetical protein
MNPFHISPSRSILTLLPHLRIGVTSSFFPSPLPTNILYALLISPTRATFPDHHNQLDLIARIIFDEEYKVMQFPV